MGNAPLVFVQNQQILVCPVCAESYGVRTHVVRDPERFASYSETMRRRHLCRKHRKPVTIAPAPTPDPWRDAWAAYEREAHAAR